MRLNTETVADWLKENRNLKLLTPYTHSKQKITVECPKGHRTSSLFDNIKKWTHHCPGCNGHGRLDTKFVANWLAENRGLKLLTPFTVSQHKITVECPREHRTTGWFDRIKTWKQDCPECYRLFIIPENKKWTPAHIMKTARKFKHSSDFKKAYPGAYRAAMRQKILKDVTAHMKPKKRKPRKDK